MKWGVLIIFVLIAAGALALGNTPTDRLVENKKTNSVENLINRQNKEIISMNLEVPWAIGIMPDQKLLITERNGKVRLDNKTIHTFEDVRNAGEGGLLGVAIHPKFTENSWVYFYYTFGGTGSQSLNRVVRMDLKGESLTNPKIIIDNIPGNSNHNGGRIKFGPDGYLYIGTGDAQAPSEAQNTKSYAGKILRINENGEIPQDNPFGNAVFSYGHRNVQGLAWDSQNHLWATEHGRSGVQSGLDELNLIVKGGNYGWPVVQGDMKKNGMIPPVVHSGNNTWAPSGVVIVNDYIYFAGLRGQALYQTQISGETVGEVKELYKNEFGRIREVVWDNNKGIYISTSNRDGRGNVNPDDDKVIWLGI